MDRRQQCSPHKCLDIEPDQWRVPDETVSHHGANYQRAILLFEGLSVLVHCGGRSDTPGIGKAELHQGNQALAARQNLRIALMLSQ